MCAPGLAPGRLVHTLCLGALNLPSSGGGAVTPPGSMAWHVPDSSMMSASASALLCSARLCLLSLLWSIGRPATGDKRSGGSSPPPRCLRLLPIPHSHLHARSLLYIAGPRSPTLAFCFAKDIHIHKQEPVQHTHTHSKMRTSLLLAPVALVNTAAAWGPHYPVNTTTKVVTVYTTYCPVCCLCSLSAYLPACLLTRTHAGPHHHRLQQRHVHGDGADDADHHE